MTSILAQQKKPGNMRKCLFLLLGNIQQINFLNSQGITASALGPTLLDLQEIYQTQMETITLVVLFQGIGRVSGSFTFGIILDKLPKFRYLILFSCCCIMGIFTALLPHMGFIWGFFGVTVISNFACSGIGEQKYQFRI